MDFSAAILAEFDREIAHTRDMLNAIPADVDWNYSPHPKSMTLGRLAGHTAETACAWATSILTADKLIYNMEKAPYVVADKAEMISSFDAGTSVTRKALAELDPAKWDGRWKLVAGDQTWLDLPRYAAFRDCVLNHTIHHRAQIGVYLRILNQPIPGIYGPSADSR